MNAKRFRARILAAVALCVLCACTACSSGASIAQSAVSSNASAVHVAVISDAHIAGESDSAYRSLQTVLDTLSSRQPGTVLCVNGDAVNSGTEEQYNLVVGALAQYGYSTQDGTAFATIGNHECADSSFSDDWLRFEQAWGYTNTYHDLVVGSAHLIGLGSDEDPSDSSKAAFSDEELTWLDGLLAQDAQDGLTSIVLCHQPLNNTVRGTSTGDNWSNQIDDDEALRAVLDRYDDVLFVSAHSHIDLTQPDSRYRQANGIGPLFVRDGALSKMRQSTGAGGSVQGLLIDVVDSAVTVSAYDYSDSRVLWTRTYFK